MPANRKYLLPKLVKARQKLKTIQTRVAELEALLAEDRYQRVLDNLIEGCQIIGFDWRYLYVNEVTAQQGHQPKEALLGYTMMEKYPGIENTAMFSSLKTCMEDRTAQHMENEFIFPDGTKSWFELRIQPVAEGIFVLSLDITERKQAETALQRYVKRIEILHDIDISIIEARSTEILVKSTLKQFRQLVPCERAAVILFDQEKNEALFFATDIDGFSEAGPGTRIPALPASWLADFPSSGVKIIADLLALPNPLPAYNQAIKEGMRSVLHVLLMSEGQPIGMFNLLTSTPGFFTNEHQEIAVEVANQVTVAMKQMRLSEALTRHAQIVDEMRQFLQTTLDAFPANTAVLDPDGTIITVNLPWKEFGTENSGLLTTYSPGVNYLTVCDTAVGPMSEEAAAAAAGIRAVIEGRQEDFYLEYPCNSPTTERWFMLRATPFMEPPPRRVVVAHINTTERKAAETAEHEQRELAEALRDSLAVLTASLDVETIMQQILLYSATAIPSEAGTIILFEGNQGRVAYSRGYSKEAEAFFKDNLIPLEFSKYTKDSGHTEIYLAEDTSILPEWVSFPMTNWVRSSIGVSIVLHGTPIGLLIADSATPNRFQQKDVERLQTFARYASLALEKAQHVDQLEQQVTERTAKLEQAKKRVEVILNNSVDGILLLNSNLHIQQTNATFNRVFACQADEYFDRSLLDLIQDQDVNWVSGVIDTLIQEHTDRRIEVVAKRKDGTYFDAELGIGYVKNDGFICTIQNITERKAQERQLRFYASLQENVSDAVIATDMSFHIQSWNRAAERIYGWQEEEVKGRTVDEILQMHYTSPEQHLSAVQQLREQGWWNGEVIQHHKDGSEVYILGSVTLIKDAHGVPLGVVSVNHDNTERKKADQILQAKLDEEREFQVYLKRLHNITIELTQIEQIDQFYKRAVELGLEQFGFERLGLLLYDADQQLAIGTYGTDAQGKLYPEHHLKFDPGTPTGILSRTLTQDERFSFDEHAQLYSDLKPIGWGWNAAAALWKGAEYLGWLAADNGVHHTPASRPLLDILSLYALTLSTLLLQKRGEFALRESETRYRLLAENITDVIVRFTPEGIYLYASPSAKAVLGYEPEEAIGKSFFDFIHPDDIIEVLQSRQEEISQGTLIPLTYRFRHAQGHYIWLEVVRQPIRSGDTGQLEEYIASARDVTTRKQAEEALRESEEKFRQLLDAAPVATIITDPMGRITLVNIQAEILFGYDRAELIGQTVEILVPEHARDKHIHNRGNYLESPRIREMGHGLDLFGRRKDASKFSVEIQLSYIETKTGVQVMSFIVDITERKKIAAELERQRTFLRQIIDVSPSMIFVKDHDSRFVLVNPMMAKIYGTTVEALIGRTDADFNTSLTEIEAFLEADQRVIDSGEPLFAEEPITNSAGETRWLQTTKVPIISADGNSKHVLGVSTDITERRNSEEALRQALEKEKELGELKSRFISMASHEFRTPLATILALTETLMAYRHRLPDEQIEVRLRRIQDQIEHLKDIMEDVLLLARMQERRVGFNPTKLNLDGLCRSVIDEFQSRPDVSHKLVYTCDERLQAVTLDKKLMRQIINNLVSNAVKYSSGDKTITISLKYQSERLIFQVQDEGIGIPDADLKHLFEPFHRAANVETISGTGLGMVITKESVELHGGTISVESQVGIGTTFTVSIPLNIERERSDDKNSGH